MASEPSRFTFLRCLGRGGFGEVYLAQQRRPGGLVRKVAVKVLNADRADAEIALRRLVDEARFLAVLDHPSILGLLELTWLSGRPALVTEFVEGLDLSTRCTPERLLPPRVVVGIVAEVAHALDTAVNTLSPVTGQPLNLIHRDIKPANIRLGRHGEVKLLDFGIARTSEIFRESNTDVGHVPFTPGYAAPESYVRGEHGPPADLYALGVTTFRLLTGQRFFHELSLGDQFRLCATRAGYEAYLTERLQSLPAEGRLRPWLAEALCWAPEERPTAAAFASAAEELADTLPGPNHARWARSMSLGDTQGEESGPLVGLTLQDEGSPIEINPGKLPGKLASLGDGEMIGALVSQSALLSSGSSLPGPAEGLQSLPIGGSASFPGGPAPELAPIGRSGVPEPKARSLNVMVFVGLLLLGLAMGGLVIGWLLAWA